ncbi:hypothetical protein [Marinobacter sp. S6332]|uniref:hypothetical protein n=1 Tax=Marinobacter sp. S6332 TaxID=2926403 RepID=UPI001FF1C99F|nr:hypothetical protein [Marinobacter sp. S6332]MCK0165906.1 hypothetical protein [Marinobacter sp. S6332]
MKKTESLDEQYERKVNEGEKLLGSLEQKGILESEYLEAQSDFVYLVEKHIPFEVCSDGKKMERLIDLDDTLASLEQIMERNS